jgi:hypothetical protein
MSSFIASFHFEKQKLTPEWCKKAKDYYCIQSSNVNLLAGKKVAQIEGYYTGDFDMLEYKLMFKSMQKKLAGAQRNIDGGLSDVANNIDTIGIDWGQFPIIPSVINSATENIMKLPMDVSCTAQDALAMKKREEDFEFLKNKPLIEEDLQDIADQMQVGKVDIGGTKNSSTKFTSAPMGLDLNNQDHKQVFSQLFYSLRVETAFEKYLKQLGGIKNIDMIRRLLVTDHFKYGVAVLSDYVSSMTKLPDVDYIHPSRVSTPASKLPDYSDNTHRVFDYSMTPMEMFNYFSDEICNEQQLDEILNGKKTGYCDCNKMGKIYEKNWDTQKLNIKLVEVKSLDWVGVSDVDGKKEFTMDESKCTSKIWAQNTYRFWWLANTDYCFGIEVLPFSHRTKGKESFQNFSSHIYRSQPKSAVELSISENRMAQIAYIKLQHSLIKSLPQGKYINLKFLRGALSGLKEENTEWTQERLINLAFEQNIFIGDTEGFDGRNDGQLKPFEEIPGGLRADVTGYWTTILTARQNIGYITGINQQLTGQNSEELIGLQQMQINSGLNSINYCNIGIQNQLEGLYNNWAFYLQGAIEAGGKTREAIVNYIGEDDTDLLDSLDEAPLHDLTIKIDVGQQQLRMQAYETQLFLLKQRGVITTADEYLLSAVDNQKEKFQKLYFVEEKWKQEQDKIRQENYANSQALMAKQGENIIAGEQAKGAEAVKEVYAKGDVQSKILQLSQQLNLSKSQTDALLKLGLQKDRNVAQKDKAIATIREKSNAKQQEAIV